jgi:hypothetical protein
MSDLMGQCLMDSTSPERRPAVHESPRTDGGALTPTEVIDLCCRELAGWRFAESRGLLTWDFRRAGSEATFNAILHAMQAVDAVIDSGLVLSSWLDQTGMDSVDRDARSRTRRKRPPALEEACRQDLLRAAKEARDACAALFRFAAATGKHDEAMLYIARAGVRDGFGVRLQQAIAAMEEVRRA